MGLQLLQHTNEWVIKNSFILLYRFQKISKSFLYKKHKSAMKDHYLELWVKHLSFPCQLSAGGFDLFRKSMNRSPLPRSPLMHHNSLKHSCVCKWGSFIRLLLQVIQWFGYDITQITHYIHGYKKARMQHCIMQMRLDKPWIKIIQSIWEGYISQNCDKTMLFVKSTCIKDQWNIIDSSIPAFSGNFIWIKQYF